MKTEITINVSVLKSSAMTALKDAINWKEQSGKYPMNSTKEEDRKAGFYKCIGRMHAILDLLDTFGIDLMEDDEFLDLYEEIAE